LEELKNQVDEAGGLQEFKKRWKREGAALQQMRQKRQKGRAKRRDAEEALAAAKAALADW
jgi:ribosomal protein S21